jgi:hypothetical protein
MSAVNTIQTLLTLGVQVSTAATKSGQTLTSFLSGPGFTAIAGSVTTLLQSLQPQDLQNALNAIQKKETDLLAGRDITALSVDELTQFHALVAVERQVVSKLVAAPPGQNGFLSVLVNDVLPTLLQVVKIVIPLLT